MTLDLISDEGRKLKPDRSTSFRIGALPKDLGEGIQAESNYSPVFEIQLLCLIFPACTSALSFVM